MSKSVKVAVGVDNTPSSPLTIGEDELPSCSNGKGKTTASGNEISSDKINDQDGALKDADVVNITTAEEYLLSKGILLLDYERQMFLDMVHADALLVAAK